MASLLVLVAHSGRTLQLDVQPSTRVDAVQHALVSFTGIPVADQIAMYQGARLDPAKLLGAYRLPVDPTVAALEDHPVFLYCRSYLKPGAALPPPEALPPLQVQVPPLAEVNLTHPLHSAPSPLVRALPDYERHFQHHLATTRAYWDVAQARLQRCRQLLSEQEVQARAADAARANVEAHYNYILNSYQTFLDKYTAQHAAHAALLATFPSDLAALEAIELHPALQQPEQQQQPPTDATGLLSLQMQPTGGLAAAGSSTTTMMTTGGGPRRLSDLYPVQRLREWAETCSRSHASFGAKVSELEALFQLLRKDVEGLFMQAPSVDLDALGSQMSEHEALLDEHSSMVQVLSKDLRTVRTLVEDVVRQLGSGAGAPGGGGLRQGGLHDAAAAMEAIHETHRNRVLPRLAQLDGQLAAFAARVEASKVAMSRDVLGQLQRISGQQSRIRDMKNKLAAFLEVLGRQDAAFAELRAVHRLPSAYRALLAEVVRRSAWHQLYCGQAGRLAEHMARFRDKEAGRRAAFSSHVTRYIPTELLARAGLTAEPPHCQVTVPPPDVPLIAVALADLQRLSYLDERRLAASTSLRASVAPASATTSLHHQHQQHHQAHQQQQQHQHQHHHHSPHHHHHHHHQQSPSSSRLAGTASLPFPGTVAVLDADPPPPTDSGNALEMENARLRAELANHIAAACIRELTATPANGSGGGGESQEQSGGAAATAAADALAAQQQPNAPPAAAAAAGRQLRISAGGVAGASASPPAAAATTGSPSAPPRRDPAEVLAAMQRALGMKDDLIRHQQREIAALSARSATYEERITALEALLTQRATAGAAAAGPSGSHSAAAAAVVTETGDCRRLGNGEEQGQPGQEASQGEPAATAAGLAADAGGEDVGEAKAGRLLGEADDAGTAVAVAGTEAGVAGGSGGGAAIEPGGTDGAAANAAAAADAGAEECREEDGSAAPLQLSGTAKPAGLHVDVDEAAAAAPASPGATGSAALLSPFSRKAAQQQPEMQRPDGAGAAFSVDGPPLRGESGEAAVSRRRAPSAADTSAAAATAAISMSTAGSAPLLQSVHMAPPPRPPHRGSSGPQAIPQAPGGLRRGGGSGSNGINGEPGVPYGSRVPMSMGSLPFATSLPVGSALVSRMACSPSGGIGLGLALGFGLAALAEGPSRRPSAAMELGHGGGSGSSSSRSSGSGSGSSGSGSAHEAEGSQAAGGRGHRRESSPAERLMAASGGGGGSSSGSGLQFQPSWSAHVSGESATGPSSADAVTAGASLVTDDGPADGAILPAFEPEEMPEAGVDGVRGGGRESGGGGGGGVAALGTSGAGVETDERESCRGGPGDDGDVDVDGNVDGDSAAAEDVPDIDEVCGSDGAWEVASEAATTATAAMAVGAAAAAGDAELAGSSAAPPCPALGTSGGRGDTARGDDGDGDDDAAGGSCEALAVAAAAAAGMDTSSGYESVGSVVSNAADG